MRPVLNTPCFWELGGFTVSIREMFSNLTHQFLGMVHKQPPQFEPCLEYLFSVTRAGGHGTGEPGVPGKVPRHLLLFMKPRQGPGSGSSGAEEWKSRETQRFLLGLRATLRTHGASITSGSKRAGQGRRWGFTGDTASPDISRVVPGHPKTHNISSCPYSQSWGRRCEGGPQARPPRAASAYSPASGRARGRLSLRTDRSRPGARPLPFARSALAPPPGGGTRGRAGISGRPS